MRAKFRVNAVSDASYVDLNGDEKKYSELVRMNPVYSNEPEHENKFFWNATPSGNLDMYISNPEAFGKLEQGKEYYLDFTEA